MKEKNIEENSSNWIYITKDKGIKKKILKEGKGDPPTIGSEVYIKYLGMKYNNQDLHKEKDKIFAFKLGEQKIIKGVEIALKTMKIGEIAELLISPHYAFENKETNFNLGNSSLTIILELLKFIEPIKEFDMTYEKKITEVKILKENGVEKFKVGDINSARHFFTVGVVLFENMDKNWTEDGGVNLYITTLSNLCNCCNRQKDYNSVINFATKGLKIKEFPKLYYFRAIAYANNNELDLAKKDLESLKKLLGEKERETDEAIKSVNKL